MASLPNIFSAFPSPPVTVDRSVAVPAARFSAGVSIAPACAALKPWRAKFSVASAASCIPNTELAAAFFMVASSVAASSLVDPMVAWTSFIDLSTDPNSFTDVAPSAITGIVTPAVSAFPVLSIAFPIPVNADDRPPFPRLPSIFCALFTDAWRDLSSFPAILIATSYSLIS